MRIRQLKLLAFGPFSDGLLDFSPGKGGLHFVFGPNEAGKSSALRAIGNLLYGIPPRSADDFVHQYKQMRIGAVLEHSDGSVVEFRRRKANSNTLRGADDQQILDDAELDRFLGGVDRNLFETMFGIDHSRLRQGGQEILEGGGQIGELLFAAGAGVAHLRDVQQRLQSQIDDLFKSGGQNPAINKGIRDLQDARGNLKQIQLSCDEWGRHEQELRRAEDRLRKLDETLREQSRQKSRLTRIHAALPVIARWKKDFGELKSFQDAPLLPDDFSKLRGRAVISLEKAKLQHDEAKAVLERLGEQLESLCVPDEMLAAANAIEALRDRLGSHRKAVTDRPGLETSLQIAESDVREILQKLGRAPQLEGIETLRLPASKVVHIQNLGNQRNGLVEKLQAAKRECERLRRNIAEAEAALAETGVTADSAPLREGMRRIQKQGDLESLLDHAVAEAKKIEQDAAVRLERLSLWHGTLERVEALPVPSQETIERFEETFQQLGSNLKSHQERKQAEEKDLRKLQKELDKLEREHAVPTEQSLLEARRLREQGWQLVLAAWREDRDDTAAVAAFTKRFEAAHDLAAGYERSVEEADQVVDQLRREADRVAMKARLIADQEQPRQQIETLNEEIKQLERRQAQLETEWGAQWASIEISPLPPREMRAWLGRQQELVQLASRIREKRLETDAIRCRIDADRRELIALLEHHQAASGASDEPLRALLQRGQDQLDSLQRMQTRREQLDKALQGDRDELTEATTRLAEGETDLARWQKNWAAEMDRLGLEEHATTAEANSVLSNITDLFQKLLDADRYRIRIEGIDRDAAQFQADAVAVARDLDIDPSDSGVVELVEDLSARLRAALAVRDKRESLTVQRDEQLEKSSQATRTISKVEGELNEMCRQAGCNRHDELPEAERRSLRRRDLERSIQDLELQLLAQSGGAGLQTLIAEAEASDPDALQPAIDALEREIERLGGERDEVLRTTEREKNDLARMDGNAKAAEQAEECENLISRLEEHTHEFAVLRVASALLNAGVERYREKNQGPILEQASRLFAKLTLGSFSGLRTDLNDSGKPVLMGVRSGGNVTVGVEGMSDGTCDQLYLALRIASLETWLEHHEPIPFIADDVLLNFDNDRAAVAMQALAEVSTRTQVIFFTHHDHVVTMAEACLPPGLLHVHRLDGRT